MSSHFSPTGMRQFVPCLCLIGIVVAGCCSTNCRDYVPLAKMPCPIRIDGDTYYIMDHVSIDQLFQANYERFGNPGVFDAIKEKFPNNQELVAYADQVEKRYQKVYVSKANYYEIIQSALKKSHGELYDYVKELGIQSPGEGKQAKLRYENGWLILAHGKIYGKYNTAIVSMTGGTESELRDAWKQMVSPKF